MKITISNTSIHYKDDEIESAKIHFRTDDSSFLNGWVEVDGADYKENRDIPGLKELALNVVNSKLSDMTIKIRDIYYDYDNGDITKANVAFRGNLENNVCMFTVRDRMSLEKEQYVGNESVDNLTNFARDYINNKIKNAE